MWSTCLKTREKVQNLFFGVNLEFQHVKRVSFLFVSFFYTQVYELKSTRRSKAKWDYL